MRSTSTRVPSWSPRSVAAAVTVAALTVAAPAPGRDRPSLTALAEQAGCTVKTLPSEGFSHTDEPVRYRSNPPTSGAHPEDWAEDGAYAIGAEPAVGQLVHALEHGRVILQHRDGVGRKRLRALFDEPVRGERRWKSILVRNTTGMKYAIAATAWRRLAGCPRSDAKSIRVLREFRRRYVDRGPEVVP